VSGRDEVLARYELVMGMEVHAQLNTRTKLFCGCKLEFAAPPNSRTCPVCLGHPGVLPVLNAAAFEKGLRLAAAFEATIAPATEFDRKNYYYPDLPKNFQISQMFRNLGEGGRLQLLRSGKVVRMHNVHLEEDAGKLSHSDGGRASTVDLNRAGTPLAEIVTMPDFRSLEEVDDYMDTLTEVLRVLDVCRCQMQEGNLRFEVSISVRPAGADALGQRTEIKNLNSYSAVRRAITYEHARQVALLEAKKTPRQETRLWDGEEDSAYEAGVADAWKVPAAAVRALLPEDWEPRDGDGQLTGAPGGRTRFMRSKEDAHDYRYFPEPDLPAFAIDPARVEAIRRGLPELPGPRRARYAGLGVPQKTAEDLARNAPLAGYFEALIAEGVPAVDAANYVMNQVTVALKKADVAVKDFAVPPTHLAELHRVITSGQLPKDLVLKKVWPEVIDKREAPAAVIARLGLKAVDEGAMLAVVDAAFAANPKAVADLLAGKDKARGAIVGAVQKQLKGAADLTAVNARIDELVAAARKT
jgi:aspartyl-tRNA(Asn)/glutamyl-tRNA(Gln) amidotransferase subunit B